MILTAIVLGYSVVGCGLFSSTGASGTCDGVSAELGGCDPDRATFTAMDCASIAHEFGSQLDKKILAIIDGGESAEESKATRVGNVTVVTASLANRHIRREGLVKTCDAAAFVSDAESVFSERFRSVVGGFLHDGPPVDYTTWRSNLVAELGIIDVEEDAPLPS